MSSWEVRESTNFMLARTRIDIAGDSWENIISGVRWLLSRDPYEVGAETAVEDILAVTARTVGATRHILIFYRVLETERAVVLLSVIPYVGGDDVE